MRSIGWVLVALAMAAGRPCEGQEAIFFVSDRDGDREIYRMQTDGGRPTNLSRHPGRDQAPTVSPDGRRIAWLSNRGGVLAVWTMRVDGSNKRHVADVPEADFGLAWSPRGPQLALTVQPGRAGPHDLALLDLETGEVERVTRTPDIDEVTPAWSPDGAALYYVTGRGTDTSVEVLELDADRRATVATGLPDVAFPSISPSGREVLLRSRDGQFDIVRLDRESGALEGVVRGPANDWGGIWYRDGEAVLFASDRDGDMEIYELDLSTGDVHQLTDNQARDWMPAAARRRPFP